MQPVTVWRCCCRETSTNRCSGTVVMEDGRTNHLCCSNLLSAKFNFTCFFFPDGAKLLCPAQGWCHGLDAPEALMGLSEFWCPICSWTAGTPWMNVPNSLCAWITHSQHHLLVLSPEPARKASLLMRRKCPNKSFLHPYDTFSSATLEIYLVGAACPGARKDSLHPAVAGYVHLVIPALECRGWSRNIWGVGFLF